MEKDRFVSKMYRRSLETARYSQYYEENYVLGECCKHAIYLRASPDAATSIKRYSRWGYLETKKVWAFRSA